MKSSSRQIVQENSSVIDWLLESDPSIRWQVLRDLLQAPEEEAAAEQAKIATEGWGAQILAGQSADGFWDSGEEYPEWIAIWKLLQLRIMGLDPKSVGAQRAVALVRDNATWTPEGAPWHGKPIFEGEVEPCINGRVVIIGAYYGVDVQGIVDRLLGEQMADGGWNCDQEIGSTRGSFHSTICVLEGLLEYDQVTGGSPAVREALERGQEYLLERRLLRRLSTGEVIDPSWTKFAFPTSYRYDILRGLDHMRQAGVAPDERMAEAIDLVKAQRQTNGRWLLEDVHPNKFDDEPDVTVGEPSHWNTLRALRVLDWYAAG